MDEITKYYLSMEDTYKENFEENTNKLHYVPKTPFPIDIFESVTLQFGKAVTKGNCIGSGSFGSVSLCQVEGIKKKCVMKTMNCFVSVDELKAELTVLDLRTQIKFVPKILYAGMDLNDHYVIIMECISGGTLDYHIRNHLSEMSIDAMKVIFYQIAAGLNVLHGKHRTHGDLKSDNIGLTAKGNVKLFDFGNSRNISKPCVLPRVALVYEAPENIQRLEANESIDWWSYGILVVRMLQTKYPFYHKDETILEKMILNDEPNITIDDPDAKDFVMKLLLKDPKLRIKNPRDHAFIFDFYERVPIYDPGELLLRLKPKSLKNEEGGFGMSMAGKQMVLDEALLRYPTKKCARFMMQR